MNQLNVKEIVINARQRLGNKDYRRLVMIHTGVTVAFALVSILLQFMLAEGIGNTGGLSGMGTRSLLETFQTVLQGANTLLIPFWNLGFLYVAMQWYRGSNPHQRELLTGFRRIGPYVGLLVNRMLMSLCVMIVTIQLCSGFFAMTPAAEKLAAMVGDLTTPEAMYAYMEQITDADLLAMGEVLLPMLILWGVLCLVILVPLLYRFRLAEYVILDQKGMRGFGAMIISASLLRRRCWQLFKLDLQFWWYYGLKAVCTLLCYLDVFLPMVGVELPVGGDAAYLLTYVVYLVALFGVEVAFRPLVDTAYAGVYEEAMAMGPVRKKKEVPAKQEQMPWDEE